MSTEKPVIKVQEVLALLKKGYTRYMKDDEGYGSIQDHYKLTGVEVKELFQHHKLKSRKTILPKAGLIIVDEEEVVEDAPAEPNLSIEEVVVGAVRTIVEAEGQPINPEAVVESTRPTIELVDVTEEVKKNLFS